MTQMPTETLDACDQAQAFSQNRVVVRLKAGCLRIGTRVEMTTAGLVAVGGLVSSILLSTAALVWVATAVLRARPTLSLARFGRRR